MICFNFGSFYMSSNNSRDVQRNLEKIFQNLRVKRNLHIINIGQAINGYID